MQSCTKDQIESIFHQLQGKTKQKAGPIANDANLSAKGKTERLAGKTQKKTGQIPRVLEK